MCRDCLARLREARPTAIAWLRDAADRLPGEPGLLCVGLGNELMQLRVADASLRAVALAALGADPAAGRSGKWVAWQVIVEAL